MNSMTKLHVGLLVVVCTFGLIDASCLSYGHSCWGAHGKRSFGPQREMKPGEMAGNDNRWTIFKIFPERMNELYRNNPQLPNPEMELKPSNFIDQQVLSAEDAASTGDKDIIKNVDTLSQDNEEFQRQPQRLQYPMKPFQVVRMNKPLFE